MMRDEEGNDGAVRNDDNIVPWRVAENLADGRVKSQARLVRGLLSQTQRVRLGKEGRNCVVKMLFREIGDIRSIMLV